ncbi:MAG: WbuC family cupin fold metalloprotein [Burkholderiaceae bacterium]
MTLALNKINEEVFVAAEPIVRMGMQHMSFLKAQALANNRKRARICAHRSKEDSLHEMFIAISADSYIHPHKHIKKVESFHIVEGLVDVVVFDDVGTIVDVIELGDISTGKNFYYRLADSMFHTLLIHTEFLIVHEVTNGPFVLEESIYASFAPLESQRADALAYISDVKRAVAARRLHN